MCIYGVLLHNNELGKKIPRNLAVEGSDPYGGRGRLFSVGPSSL